MKSTVKIDVDGQLALTSSDRRCQLEKLKKLKLILIKWYNEVGSPPTVQQLEVEHECWSADIGAMWLGKAAELLALLLAWLVRDLSLWGTQGKDMDAHGDGHRILAPTSDQTP